MRRTGRKAFLGVPAALGLLAVWMAPGAMTAAAAQTPTTMPPCRSSSSGVQLQLVTFDKGVHTFDAGKASAVNGQYGYYALPPSRPVGIVAVAHGYQQTAYSMADPREYTSTGLLETIAAHDDVIAVSMDYSGQSDGGPGTTSSRGWKVTQGAADLIAVSRLFDAACQPRNGPPLVNTVFGESMGGDSSGIAAAAGATTGDGAPLFDYWFDISGVTNVAETWLEASAAGPADAYAAQASADIETEFGGSPAQQPAAYAAASPALLANQMRASGIAGVAVFHAVMDGLVTSDEGDQMAAALQAARIPTDFYTAAFQEPGASSTTLDGDALGVAAGLVPGIPAYNSPFAGHVDGIVMDTAINRLSSLYNDDVTPHGFRATLSDGKLGTIPVVTVPGI